MGLLEHGGGLSIRLDGDRLVRWDAVKSLRVIMTSFSWGNLERLEPCSHTGAYCARSRLLLRLGREPEPLQCNLHHMNMLEIIIYKKETCLKYW